MNYKDENFTPQELCNEIWDKYGVDLEFEETDKGDVIFTPLAVDGKCVISKDAITHIFAAYDGCWGEGSGARVLVSPRKGV